MVNHVNVNDPGEYLLVTNCRVCNSSFRLDYEGLRYKEQYTIENLLQYAESKGEHYSWNTMGDHMRDHCQAKIDMDIKSDTELRNTVRARKRERIKVLDELYENLSIAKKLSNQLVTDPDLSASTKVRILSEIRMTLESVLKARQQESDEPDYTKEELVKIMIEAVSEAEIPPEYIDRLRRALQRRIGIVEQSS